MEISEQALWTLDAIFAFPFIWAAVYLVGGGFSGSGARFAIDWPWCFVGLASMAWVILRVAEVIHS